jgi:hypothetical protein
MSSMNSSQRKVCEGSGDSGKPHFSETTVASDEELRWIDDGFMRVWDYYRIHHTLLETCI